MFVRDGLGGNMVSIPCGILNAIMVNVGAVLVMKLTPRLRFKSIYQTQLVSVLLIFILSYLSLGILIMRRYSDDFYFLPADYTKHWLIFYGKMIGTQMLMSNLLQYLGPMFKILFKRGCCCCKCKGYKLNKNLNQEFSFERRYGTVLTTVFTCFTYGYAIPMLFIMASFVFFLQFVLDKMLITFYYKERIVHNDFLNRCALRVLKYCVCPFLYFGATALRNNYCTIDREVGAKNYAMQFGDCRKVWSQVVVMYSTCFVFAFFFLFSEVYSYNECCTRRTYKSAPYKQLKGFN